MSNIFVTFLMLLLVASGGPNGGNRTNDLLDLIPTASYWRVKGVTVSREQLETDIGATKGPDGDIPALVKDLESLRKRDAAKKQLEAIGAPALESLRAEAKADDPEAAAFAKELITSISGHGKVAAVRRLIAIRTLGERKEKDSLPLLKSLLESKEMFVADYAARAISAIDGTPQKPVDRQAELAKDLDMLPASTGIVGQMTGVGMPGFTLESLVAQAWKVNHPDAVAKPAEINDSVDELTKKMLEYAEAVGNVRADGMTMAVSADIGAAERVRGAAGGGGTEWALISVRGEYDREAVADFMSKLAAGRGTPVVREGVMLSLSMSDEEIILFPSDKQLIFATANPEDTPLATLTVPLLEAITTGKPGTLADNPDLSALIKSVDKTGPLWIAGMPSPMMKTVPALAAFDTMTLSAKEGKDAYVLTVTGRGRGDAVAAKDQVESLQKMLLDNVKQDVGRAKDLSPLVDAVDSIKVTVEDAGATATAKVPKDITQSILLLMLREMPGLIPEGRPAEAMPLPRGGEYRDAP